MGTVKMHRGDSGAIAEGILRELRAQSNPDNVAGMARYGITAEHNLGVQMPVIRELAKNGRRELGRDPSAWHELASALWATGVRDAWICAALCDAPELVTDAQMDSWVAEFDSWDVCDGVCLHLFDRSPLAWEKAAEYAADPREFVKRAGFVLMAGLAVHAKREPDDRLLAFLPLIRREAGDPRNFVKKAVNWALRQIGKRSAGLNAAALECAETILAEESGYAVGAADDAEARARRAAARWVARDALRDLTAPKLRERLAQ